MEKVIRTRFAPSPTGYMHVGGLRTALYGYMYAKRNNGKFILRIEDTDQERFVEGAIDLIIKSLRETGLIYDEGPDVGGDYGPYIQSQRKNEYMKYALQLIEQGDAYYCFCDKERLESLPDINGARRYDKHCLSLSKAEIKERLDRGDSFVIRQNIPTTGASSYVDAVFGLISVENSELEDNILIKSDGMPTYNFANVIDDHLMDINVVMRGIEYLSSTPKYNLLYDAFGWERPEYIHLQPVMRDAQHKLSKRHGDPSYEDLKQLGFLKDAIINYVALLGWSPKNNQEKMSFEEIKEHFSIEGLNKSPSIFDIVKLKWLNSLYIKEIPFEKFVEIATPYLDKSKVSGKFDYAKICKLIQGRIETLNEIAEKVDFLAEFGEFDKELFIHQKQKSSVEIAQQVLPRVVAKLSEVSVWNNDNLYAALQGLGVEMGLKNSQILYPTRIAVSGRESTPGGATELMDLLGKDETIRRINFTLDKVLK